MKLAQLLEGMNYTLHTPDGCPSPLATEVVDITNDSRRAVSGGLFFAIRGANSDGHDYAAQVAAAGAAVLVVEHEVEISGGTGAALHPGRPIQVVVPSTRRAMAEISAAFYGHPARNLSMIGITGTKGKTTTTYLVKSILEGAGIDTGLIGTIEMTYHDVHRPAANTTPESIELQRDLKEMADAGVQAVVMEVSSQALMMDRTAGIEYDIGVFTNLSEDHIGPNEHRDFEDYLRCKSLLFRQCRVGIVNGDDPYVDRILAGSTCRVERFGLQRPEISGSIYDGQRASRHEASESASDASASADNFASDCGDIPPVAAASKSAAAPKPNDLWAENPELIHTPGELGIRFDAKGLVDIPGCEVPTPGSFSIYNAMAAVAICRHFHVGEEDVRKALRGARTKGRIELIPLNFWAAQAAVNALPEKSEAETKAAVRTSEPAAPTPEPASQTSEPASQTSEPAAPSVPRDDQTGDIIGGVSEGAPGASAGTWDGTAQEETARAPHFDFTLMIDYAHNAVALESLLTTLKEYEPHRLVTLFGCGGNRAKSRRFEMGEVSGRLSDFTIITSDNPRFEEPMDIIADIVTGISKTDGAYITIPDRKEAIRYAIHHGEPGDIIVLAGKGHEDYQEIRGKKYPMDERVLIREILAEDAAAQESMSY